MNQLIESLASDSFDEAGMAFNIRAIPDLFTGERFNIGVAVVDKQGQRHVKVIKDPGRLTCLYGEENAKTIVFMAKMAASAIESGHESPSPNIVFDTPTPFYNMSPTDALETLFRDQVTVAIPHRAEKKEQSHLKTKALQAKVFSLLRERSQNLELDPMIAQEKATIIPTQNGNREVFIPLQPKDGAGSIESADYSPTSVKTHLMDALLNLEFAAKVKGLRKLGLFIARPTGLRPEKARAIDNAIDYVVWRAPDNCRVSLENSPEQLVEEIIDWAEAA